MTRMFHGLLMLSLAFGISSSVPVYSAPPSSDEAAIASAKAVLKDSESTPKTLNDSVAELTALLKKSPQNAEAYCYRGELYERLNKDQESLSDFNKALELNPKFGRAYLDRGISWFMKANISKALSDFDSAIANGEKTQMAYQNRGAAYQQLNQHDKAILDFTESIKLQPSWTAHIMRANSYLITGKVDPAIKDWDFVIEAKGVPKEARTDVHQRRGLAYAISNRMEDAIQDFTVAANNLQGAQKGRVISLRASAYNKLGQKDKAEEDRKLAESLGYKKLVVKPGPPDKPVHAESIDQVKKLEEAIKPLIEKARQTLPEAKARYLKGLAPGHRFSVTTKLQTADQFEQVFVFVDGWNGTTINGTLGSEVRLPGHKQGEKLTVEEKDVLDWTISNPDGSEEGNLVGKFLDNWKG